ncbi:MAG: alpha-glucosidase C-terminal domain-containing protein [Alistipes sp.]|nr:alpha-glucosidase C-terminal domain-containing protein [Alistipes sp.]
MQRVVPHDFWADAIAALGSLKGDDLFMLAESGAASFLDSGFDMVYAWDFAYKLQDVYGGSQKVSTLYTANQSEDKGRRHMRHSTNHDMSNEKSLTEAYKTEQGAVSAFVIAATMGGCPMIYGSQEVGYPDRVSFFTNYSMDWSANPEIRSEYEKIMSVRSSTDALQASADIATYSVDDDIACYKRSDGKEEILVMVNTSATDRKISLPAEFALTQVTDLMTGSSFTTATTYDIAAYGYYIWRIGNQ